MRDAFGVERPDIIEKAIRIPRPRLVKEPAPLGQGEFWHGAKPGAADEIRQRGFSLAHGSARTRAGRPRSSGSYGPGVYATRDRGAAEGWAGGDPKSVLRVKVDGKLSTPRWGAGTTPQAAKEGYDGVVVGRGSNAVVAVGNPRKVSVVPEPRPKRRVRWS
jgi:hypothetical protein